MKGPIDLRQTEVVEFTRIAIQRKSFDVAQQTYLRAVGDLQEELGVNRTSPSYNNTITSAVSGFNQSFSGRYTEKHEKPKKGKIIINGTTTIDESQNLTNSLSYVSQKIFLFNKSFFIKFDPIKPYPPVTKIFIILICDKALKLQ